LTLHFQKEKSNLGRLGNGMTNFFLIEMTYFIMSDVHVVYRQVLHGDYNDKKNTKQKTINTKDPATY